jgi:hypothetical protein
MKIQNNLLSAESGEICDNYSIPEYDRAFRSSLVDIYSMVKISPPMELFMSLIEKEPYRPYEDMTEVVNIKCDGVVEPGEWDGALKAKVENSDFDEIYCGFGNKEIFYLLKLSTGTQTTPRSLGVLLGHMNADSAALVPRTYKNVISNIQDFPVYVDVNWRKNIPNKTVIYRTTGNEKWEVLTGNYNVGYSDGILEFTVPFKYLDLRPLKKVFFKVYAEDRIFPENSHFSVTVPDFELSRGIISYIDPVGDIYGPGNYKYPDSMEEFKGNLDLRKIEVFDKGEESLISIELSNLADPYSALLGFSLPMIDIYIDINKGVGMGKTGLLKGRKAYTSPEDAWEYCITINGWQKAIYNASGKKIGEPEISISPMDRTINIFVSKDIISASISNWGIVPVTMASDAEGELIEIQKDTGENNEEFRGRKIESDTNIIDVIVPSGSRQTSILGANRRGRAIEIPALRK